jgi:magnesium chelatase family protein
LASQKKELSPPFLPLDYHFLIKKIIVNLAPADLQKEGAHFDLSIAIDILIELGILTQKSIDNFFILGELSLDGISQRLSVSISDSLQFSSFKSLNIGISIGGNFYFTEGV